MKSFSLIILTTAIALSSCSTRTDNLKNRTISSNASEFKTEELKEVLSKSFYYMYQFDEKLNEAYNHCLRKNLKACSSPLDDDEYKKLQIYRSIGKRLKEKFVAFYIELLQIAQNKSTQSKLQTLDQEIAEKLRVDIMSDPLSFYLGSVMSEARDIARAIYDPQSINIKQSIPSYQKELESDTFNEAIKSYILANNTKQGAFDQEVQNDLKNLESRDPQNTWKNHTGRSFKQGDWALTYDDGPSASFSNKILNLLHNKQWHATFFWLAELASLPQNKAVIEKAKTLKMGLASHSYSHANLGKAGANLQVEIVEAKKVLEKIYGMKLNFFRLPYGSGTRSTRVKSVITSQNLEHFFWNVDSLDWQDPSPKSIYNRVLKQMRIEGKGIILFHDIRQRTVDVTQMMISNLERDIPGTNIIKLEDGVGVGTGNGDYVPSPREVTSFPHARKITASKLNVRTSPITGSVCGHLSRDTIIEISSQDPQTGWYTIDTMENDGLSKCPRKVYISNSSKYSLRN